MNKLALYLLIIVMSPLAAMVVVTPMDSDKQFVFAIVSLVILYLLNFSKRRDVSVVMVLFSILTSTR